MHSLARDLAFARTEVDLDLAVACNRADSRSEDTL